MRFREDHGRWPLTKGKALEDDEQDLIRDD
jgi:hypothetical protein